MVSNIPLCRINQHHHQFMCIRVFGVTKRDATAIRRLWTATSVSKYPNTQKTVKESFIAVEKRMKLLNDTYDRDPPNGVAHHHAAAIDGHHHRNCDEDYDYDFRQNCVAEIDCPRRTAVQCRSDGPQA